MKLVERVSDLIGGTPLLQIARTGTGTRLLLKLDHLNPTGSCKVRMARQMIEEAERDGRLLPGGHIVEPTSGNTGCGLALVAVERGYRFTAVVDSHAAKEKLQTLKAMGAELVFVECPPGSGPSSVLRRQVAQDISRQWGAFHPDQHNNPGNRNGYAGLAVELLEQLPKVDVLVAAIGTGGSLCGTVRELRALGNGVHAVAVEPQGSIIFGGAPGPYHQSGSGSPEGFPVGSNVDLSAIDQAYQAADGAAFATARVAARRTGMLFGGTTGAAIYVALRNLVSYPSGSTVVVLCNDAGEKYLNSVYDDDWLLERDVLDELAHRRVRRWFSIYDRSVEGASRMAVA